MNKTLVELCLGAVGILAVMISFLGSESGVTNVWGRFEQGAQVKQVKQVKLIFVLPKEQSVKALSINSRFTMSVKLKR